MVVLMCFFNKNIKKNFISFLTNRTWVLFWVSIALIILSLVLSLSLNSGIAILITPKIAGTEYNYKLKKNHF